MSPKLVGGFLWTYLGFSGVLELAQDHGGDLSWGELTGLAEVLDFNAGSAILVDDLERPCLHVLLDVLIIEAATNETLSIENGSSRVHGALYKIRQKIFRKWKKAQNRTALSQLTWFLAASPMRRSSVVKATYEGVVLLPWSLAMTGVKLEKSVWCAL